MAPSYAQLIERNKAYAATHKPAPTIEQIQATGVEPPKTCIISCVDPRVFPEQLLGLRFGEAFIFRTISGHPQPVFENIVTLDAVSHGFEDVILIYHTDCGAHRFNVSEIRSSLLSTDPNAESKIKASTFGAISQSIEQELRDDIKWMKEQPLMRKELAQNIKGYVFDLESGRLKGVE